MRIAPAPHRWALTPRAAIEVQKKLSALVREAKPRCKLLRVAGLDAAFSADGTRCIAGVVVWDIPTARVVEEHVATRKLRFPYIPGLLSFREAPALLAALRKVERAPDALLCDGHGIAHPRRFGIASHVGVLTGLPTAGVAKSRLIGKHAEPDSERGARTPLTHDGDEIASVLRTRAGVRPVYVSVGHEIDLPSAIDLVLACGNGRRLPEPTRLADQLVTRARNEL